MNHKVTLIWVVSLLFLFILAGCSASEPPVPTPTPDPDASTPADIVTVRTAAVEYLREGARCFVPARLSLYKPVTDGNYSEPADYDVYRFQSENCIVTVTTEHDAPPKPLYHVTIGDQDTGYCLQAIVSETGQVLHSGSSAAMADNPGNFSAQFCRDQGYSYEIVQRTDGGQCGACVFPDGSSCQSWEFFHGICGPGEGTFAPE